MSRYAFVPVADLNECMVSHISYQTIQSVRKSTDGVEACVEYSGEKPECLIPYECKDQEEAIQYMSDGSYGGTLPPV